MAFPVEKKAHTCSVNNSLTHRPSNKRPSNHTLPNQQSHHLPWTAHGLGLTGRRTESLAPARAASHLSAAIYAKRRPLTTGQSRGPPAVRGTGRRPGPPTAQQMLGGRARVSLDGVGRGPQIARNDPAHDTRSPRGARQADVRVGGGGDRSLHLRIFWSPTNRITSHAPNVMSTTSPYTRCHHR